ncbi:Actin-related protein 2/3 complex subunit 2A [Vitis vinifera]|uniref:Arp2/3 complex 34 kDa subunit n=1 Tax=Vitis vinifera TaxID=29760 RepID=A0A438JUU9_VITVI|nr:Actin-related protein 2/3 complex subunit 2A [Vitis vinifera]
MVEVPPWLTTMLSKGSYGDPKVKDERVGRACTIGRVEWDEEKHVDEDLQGYGFGNHKVFRVQQDIPCAVTVEIASVREVVLGAPLRVVLKHLASRTVAPDINRPFALVHRPKESFFLVPQAEKVTVVFPMRFKDSIDTVLATSFLQKWTVSGFVDDSDMDLAEHEFVEARRTAGLNNAPPCLWSPSPPLELRGTAGEALSANAGFVTFVIFPRHVEGKNWTELFGVINISCIC